MLSTPATETQLVSYARGVPTHAAGMGVLFAQVTLAEGGPDPVAWLTTSWDTRVDELSVHAPAVTCPSYRYRFRTDVGPAPAVTSE